MADPHELGCIECQRKDRVILQQQIRSRQLGDLLDDAESALRVYKRLAYEQIVANQALRDELNAALESREDT